MKKVTTILAAILLMAVGAAAQKLSYQAVVRNSSNELVPNTALTVEVSVLDAVGTVQYAETHSATTNENGLLVLTIGDGTVTAGTTVADVDWNGAAIQSVVKNGSVVVATITSPVNAVPYALQAGSSAGSLSQVNADWEATSGVAEILHKPTIPTTVAELTDAGDYVTDAELAAAGYLTAETDPTVNDGMLTIELPDGTSETFTANQSGNTTVTIPASSALTAEDLLALINGMTDEQKEQLRDALGVTGGGESFSCGSMTDADGNTYETVKIGTQCWTKTNLRTMKAADGTPLSDGNLSTSVASLTIPYYYNYDTCTIPVEVRGYLYSLGAAQVICPVGWHLPTDEEWTQLELFHGMVAAIDDVGYRGTHAAKMAGDYWESSSYANTPGDLSYSDRNKYHFSAVPAGSCANFGSELIFMYSRIGCGFWSLGSSSYLSIPRIMINEDEGVMRSPITSAELPENSHYGLSVRCVKDATGGEEPGDGGEPTSFNCGTSKMVDADGNEYETVQIGTQCWTKTNLRVAPAGATDASSSGASSNTEPYYYVNSAVNPAVYGYYYNWEAAKLACPTGWHLPSDAEWTTMEQTQTSMDVTGSGLRGDHAGKLAGEGWNPSTTAGAPGNASDPDHNASGFSAVPAGNCDGSSFYGAGDNAYFWSATLYASYPNYAYLRRLYYYNAYVNRYNYSKSYGYSVRCLRD